LFWYTGRRRLTVHSRVDTRIYEEALDDFGNEPDDFM
jgi:hypothetical protein